LLDSLRTRPPALCDPGPIVLAQFVDDLGVGEALHVPVGSTNWPLVSDLM
jgi:hypothetical protein